MIVPHDGFNRETGQELDWDEEPERNEKSVASGPVKVRVSEPEGRPGGTKLSGPAPWVPMERLPKLKSTGPEKPLE